MSDTPDTPTDTGPTVGDPAGPLPAGGGPHLGIAETVKRTGLTRSTLQRRLKAGEIPGAHQGADGTWRIPMYGLIRSGLLDRSTPPDPPTPVAPLVSNTVRTPDVEGELDRLRVELARVRAERDDALALAAERRDQADALREAVAALSRALPPAPAETDAPQAPKVKRWWRRN